MTKKDEFSVTQYAKLFPQGIDRHYWQTTRLVLVKKTIKRLTGIKPKVLEVGCGVGYVVRDLRNSNIFCNGVELSYPPLSKYLRSFIRVGINAQDLPEEERDQYNVILLLDVIEHVKDPKGMLIQLTSAFKNLKYFIITVPARKELWSEFDSTYGHYRRYDRKMIQELAECSSLSVVFQNYMFRFLYIPIRLSKHRKITFLGPGKRTIWLHALLARLFVLEYALLPKTIYGSSIICCLEKNLNK